MQRLELLKALGDNTRYAIYLEIARSASPRTTADIADLLGLHANTVRPHLERMRDVGLLDVEVVIPSEEVVKFKEGLLMALLGAMRLEGAPNCIASVTGARRDALGGGVFLG